MCASVNKQLQTPDGTPDGKSKTKATTYFSDSDTSSDSDVGVFVPKKADTVDRKDGDPASANAKSKTASSGSQQTSRTPSAKISVKYIPPKSTRQTLSGYC